MSTRVKLWLFFFTVMGAALTVGLVFERPPLPPEPQRPSLEPARRGTLSAPTEQDGLVRREVVLMGSQFVFVVEAPREAGSAAIARAVERLRELETRISSWQPGSEISHLNERAGIAPVRVSPDSFALLQLAKALHAETEGAFDVTIGAVWDLWPFRDPQRALPTPEQIRAALELVDAGAIELDAAHSTAYLPRAGMRVNLGAIGKGYAARIAIELLKTQGIEHGAVSAGGDIFLLGQKSAGPWRVGIEHPRWKGRTIEQFTLGDAAVATSGDAERYIERGGKRYGHILDPRTGYPAEGCQSVTIIADDPARADAYATAVFVLGVERGLDWVSRHPGVEALIVAADGSVHRSAGWQARIGRPETAQQAAVEQVPPSGVPQMARTTPERDLGQLPGRDLQPGTTALLPVPAGPYLAGDERRTAQIDADYRIDRNEVSNAQYRAFLDATAADPHADCHPEEPADRDHTPRYWREFRPPLFRASTAAKLAPFDRDTFTRPEHPVVGVDWWDAYAYCRWAGKRLPTAAEWERAARGADGRIWPWGDEWDFTKANGGGEKWGEQDGLIYSAPVESFPAGASPVRALNMAGNVAEWVAQGWLMGGGSNGNPSELRASAAVPRAPGFRAFDSGFRCAADGAD